MNSFTTSLALASMLGSFTQMGASEDIDIRLSTIKNAPQNERKVMIQELQFEIKQMPTKERTRVMQKVQEQMPDIAQKIQKDEIAQKIKEIKGADPIQRRELMNNFKKELAQMKKTERAEAIAHMRQEMSKKQHKEQEKLEVDQMNQLQKIERVEKRNQRQGADQFRQGIIDTGSQPGPKGFGPN